MSRAQSLIFGVAVVFAGWNILNNGLSVRSGAIALLIIICLSFIRHFFYASFCRIGRFRFGCLKR